MREHDSRSSSALEFVEKGTEIYVKVKLRLVLQAHLGKVVASSDRNEPAITHFTMTLPSDTLGTNPNDRLLASTSMRSLPLKLLSLLFASRRVSAMALGTMTSDEDYDNSH